MPTQKKHLIFKSKELGHLKNSFEKLNSAFFNYVNNFSQTFTNANISDEHLRKLQKDTEMLINECNKIIKKLSLHTVDSKDLDIETIKNYLQELEVCYHKLNEKTHMIKSKTSTLS